MWLGANEDEAIQLALDLGPAGELMRLAGADGEAKRPAIIADLREMLKSYRTPDGLVMASASWCVAARRG